MLYTIYFIGRAAHNSTCKFFLGCDVEKSKLMKLGEVLSETKMGKTKLYRLINEGRFPPQRRSGDGSALWVRGEVDYWIDCLIQDVEYEYKKAA